MNPMRNDRHTLIDVERLIEYSKHPFKVHTGKKMDDMVDSVREHGVITPIIVRTCKTDPDKFEIISGHNRVKAAIIARIHSVPAIVKEMDDDTADLLVTESNLKQRADLLPSEKAKAYKMQIDALNRQGKRNDPTSVQIEQKLGRVEVAGMNGESASQIQRYIRLTFLSPELLDSVDEKKIPFSAAVNISHLREVEQRLLSEILSGKNTKPTLAQSELLKCASADHELDRDEIITILEDDREKKKTLIKTVTIPFKSIEKYFNGQQLTEEKILDVVVKALANYRAG